MKTFVESILREEEGFSFGDPWNYKNSEGTILPIRRKGRRRRKYRTLEEVLKDTRDAIEVTESGSIRKVKILNRTDIPIFVRMGTIFAGVGTQSRAAEGSVILVPDKEARPLTVRCVEAAVPIRGGTRFNVAGFTAPLSVEMGLYARDQEEVWERVRAYARMSTSPGHRGRRDRDRTALELRREIALSDPSSLVDVMETVDTFKERVDEMLEVVPSYEDQVGLVFLDQKGVLGMETFDTPKSWEAVSDRVVKKYGDVISIQEGDKPTPAEPDRDTVVGQTHRFLQALARAKGRVTFKQSGHQTFALAGNGLVGEYTIIDGDVMHLTGVRFERRPKKKRRTWQGFRPHPPQYAVEELEGEARRFRRQTRGRDREEGVREGP